MPITIMNPTTAAQREQLRAEHAARVGVNVTKSDSVVRLYAVSSLDVEDYYEQKTIEVDAWHLEHAYHSRSIAVLAAMDVCEVRGLSSLVERVAQAILANGDSFVALNP
jgi:FlaG/FlaF family flagellin (archaellin)